MVAIVITKGEKVVKEFILDNMRAAYIFYSRNWRYIEEEYHIKYSDPDVNIFFENREV